MRSRPFSRGRLRFSMRLGLQPDLHHGTCYVQPVILKVPSVGRLVLRQPARALSADEIRTRHIQELIAHMRDTMRDAPGVGLAAPQIGLGLQVAVIEDRAELMHELAPQQIEERERRPVPFHVIINPRIAWSSERTTDFFEGCLSVPGYAAIVRRHHAVRIECLDENAEPITIKATGWHARILQHEIDHLHGTLYIDRMHGRSFCSLDELNRNWKNVPVSEVLEQVGANAGSAALRQSQ
jgi:peptide deformylase